MPSKKVKTSPTETACEVTPKSSCDVEPSADRADPNQPRGEKPGRGWKWCPKCQEWVKPKRR